MCFPPESVPYMGRVVSRLKRDAILDATAIVFVAMAGIAVSEVHVSSLSVHVGISWGKQTPPTKEWGVLFAKSSVRGGKGGLAQKMAATPLRYQHV